MSGSGNTSTSVLRNRVLLFTSLYPYPWEPTRAVFNAQQYRALEAELFVDYLIPVPFFLWFRHLPSLWRDMRSSRRRYFPMFYVPGLLRSWNLYFLAFSIIICIVPLFKLFRSKVVIASWAYPDAMSCALFKPVCRFRLFVQCLGSDINVHGAIPRHRRQLARGLSRCERVITVSKALGEEVQRIAPSAAVSTIYNGVDLVRFRPTVEPKRERSLLFIGNLLVTKGVEELVEAFSMLDADNVTLDFIGDGPARVSIEQRCKALGISDRVTLHGRLPHDVVAQYLSQFTALVLPSYSEGVPNVVVEALACGVPVVATAVGGIAEVVASDCGLLVPPQDTQALRLALEQALSNEWNPERLRSSVSHLTWQANATQVAELVSAARHRS